MNTTAISNVIENFDALSIEEKEYALQVIEKNIIESKRDELAKRVAEANENYSKGAVKQGSLKDLYQDLEND